jgi:hypothetical protein
MSNILPFTGAPIVTIPAAARIACYSEGNYSVVRLREYANGVPSEEVLFNAKGAFTSAVFATGATIVLRGGDTSPLYYSVGTDAAITERNLVAQGDPGTLNATGTLTDALITGGLVTSTTASAAVVATLDTGAVMDAAGTFAVNDAFFWSVINTGSTNAFTVTAAASGHTVVGAGAVAAGTSGRFMTRKTAANTFVTYRI